MSYLPSQTGPSSSMDEPQFYVETRPYISWMGKTHFGLVETRNITGRLVGG